MYLCKFGLECLSVSPSTARLIPPPVISYGINLSRNGIASSKGTDSPQWREVRCSRVLQFRSNIHARYTQPLGLFIDNEFVRSKSGGTLSTINPTNEEEITCVYAADTADVDTAVDAARAAFESPAWSEITPEARGRLLYKLADLIEKDSKVLATIGTATFKNLIRLSTDIGV